MTEKKLVFSDLDCTLLNDDKTISEENLKAIHKMTEAGHGFIFSTGRPLKSAYDLAKKYGLIVPGFYLSCFNGGLIYDCYNEKIIRKIPLSYEKVRYLFDEAKKAGLHAHTYGHNGVISENHTKEFDFYLSRTNMPGKIVDDFMEEMLEEPIKAIIMTLDGRSLLKDFQIDHAEWEGDNIDHTFSCDQMLEYASKEATKGNAVRFLCEYFDVPIENAIAIGDEENDITMIEAAGIGVVMVNGVDEVKEYADYITENDNNHAGVAEVIYKFVL